MVLDVKMEFYNEGNNFDLGLNNQNKDLAFVTMTKIREEVSSNSTKMNNFNKHS
jgi:predicted Zn-dependent protease